MSRAGARGVLRLSPIRVPVFVVRTWYGVVAVAEGSFALSSRSFNNQRTLRTRELQTVQII